MTGVKTCKKDSSGLVDTRFSNEGWATSTVLLPTKKPSLRAVETIIRQSGKRSWGKNVFMNLNSKL